MQLSQRRQAFRKFIATLNFNPGQVLYLDLGYIDHPKYVIVTCDDDYPFLFVVNSEICSLIRNTPEMRAAQVMMKEADYTFLDHDSWINCSEVHRPYSRERIVEMLSEGMGASVCGRLSPETKSAVIEAVEGCDLIAQRHQDAIIDYLTDGEGD